MYALFSGMCTAPAIEGMSFYRMAMAPILDCAVHSIEHANS